MSSKKWTEYIDRKKEYTEKEMEKERNDKKKSDMQIKKETNRTGG